MMEKIMSKAKSGAVLLALLVALAACGQDGTAEVTLEAPGTESQVEARSSALVTPEFRVSGFDDLPVDLRVEGIALTVASIQLTPLDNRAAGIVYSTASPLHLRFDMAGGEASLLRPTVEVPETGRFLVSVRIEPAPEGARELTQATSPVSLSLEGRVRSDLNSTPSGEPDTGKEEDGNPLPLPFHQLSVRQQESGDWTPFRYASDASITFTFNEVEFVRGEQKLTFDFDLSDWAHAALAPLVQSLGEYTGEPMERIEISDLTFDLDAEFQAPEEYFLATGTVTTTPEFP